MSDQPKNQDSAEAVDPVLDPHQSDETEPKAEVEGLPLLWTVDLGKDNPKRYAVLVAACVAGLIGLNLFNSLLLGVVGFAAIVLGVSEVFFPLKYRIDEKGISVRCGISVTALEWASVKRIINLQDSLRVSPLEKPSRLDPFRGVLVRFSSNEEIVRGKIQELTDRHGLPVGYRDDRPGGAGGP